MTKKKKAEETTATEVTLKGKEAADKAEKKLGKASDKHSASIAKPAGN